MPRNACSSLSRAARLIGLLLAVSLSGQTLVHAQPAPAQGAPSDAEVLKGSPVSSPEGGFIVGGPSRQRALLQPNTPLLQRLVLKPTDLIDAGISLKLARSAPRNEVIAEGQAGKGDVVEFGEQATLKQVKLGEGDRLLLVVWRSQWHWWGGATLSDAVIQKKGGGAVPLPLFEAEPQVSTAIGELRLVGVSKRDDLPKVKQWASAMPGKEAGRWTIEGAKGVSLQSKAGSLGFNTQGRASWKGEFDWAPGLVFEAKTPGLYQLGGTLTFTSGKAATKDQNTVSWLVLRVPSDDAKVAQDVSVRVYRLRKPVDGSPEVLAALKPGEDYDAAPLASAKLPKGPRGKSKRVALSGLGPAFVAALQKEQGPAGLLLALESNEELPLPWVAVSPDIEGEVTVRTHPAEAIYTPSVRPTDGVYVRRDGSRLVYGDRRLRLWGVAGGVGSPDSLARLSRIGFNAVRMWPKGGQQGINPYYKTDPSVMTHLPDSELIDQYDRNVAAAKEAGLFIMSPFLAGSIGTGQLVRDDSIVAGGEDWEEWKQAVQAAKGSELTIASAFDERLQKGFHQQAINVLNHRNPYTGKTYAEEETIAIWELANEKWIIDRALAKGFSKWTPYFRNKVQSRWNAWLKERYGDDAKLLGAWGALPEGESLADQSVTLAPAFPQRGDYHKARADDLVRFFIEAVAAFYKEREAVARAQAPSKDVGVAVVPFSYDTQFRPNTPWHYSTDGQADVANFGMYFFTLSSALTGPPSMYIMDSHTIAGKPTVIYETNAGRPNPYRVEQAYRTAALASWQDWDAVFWHYYHMRNWSDARFLAADLPYMSRNFYWSAVEIEKDPAMLSAIGLAGQMFLKDYLNPASNPVTYRVGGKGIFGYDRWNGVSTGRATFARGAMLKYEPGEDFEVKLDGAEEGEFRGRIEGALRSGEQIVWDWPNGRLIIDSPHAKAYVGKTPPDGGWYRFSDGVAVGEFGTDFAAFAVVSADGRPLVGSDPAKRVYVNARYDARNTGFEMDTESVYRPRGSFTNPVEQAKKITRRGSAPVVEQPVAFTLAWPQELDGRLLSYDFATRPMHEQELTAAGRVRYAGPAMFAGVLEIARRGATVDTPQTTLRIAGQPGGGNDGGAGLAGQVAAQSRLWHPIEPLDWGHSPVFANQAISDSSLVFTTRQTTTDAGGKQIRLTGAEVMLGAAADVLIRFDGDTMLSVSVTFTQPPSLSAAVETLTERFGEPVSSRLADEAFNESRVVWRQTKGDERLTTTLVETQGNLSIEFVRNIR